MLKLLTPSNQIKFNTNQRSSSHYKISLPNAFFFSENIIIQKQLYSQLLDLRMRFASLSKNATFEYYLTQPKSLLEWKLIAEREKDPKIVTLFDYRRFF